MEYYAYRRWFNQMFSLSFNGKFCGLGRLVDFGLFDLFKHKLNKLLNRSRLSRPLGDIIVMRIHGYTVKLYNR